MATARPLVLKRKIIRSSGITARTKRHSGARRGTAGKQRRCSSPFHMPVYAHVLDLFNLDLEITEP